MRPHKMSILPALLILTLLVPAAVHGQQPEQAAKPDTDPALYGKWHLIAFQGRKESEIGPLVWEFAEEHIRVINGDTGEEFSESEYRVATNASPKKIDMEIDDLVQETRLGLYEIRDGRLYLQFTLGGGPRPESLDVEEAMIFERGPSD